LNYALGDALMLRDYNTRFIGDSPHSLSPEAKTHLLESVKLEPDFLVAHLALATYYEHPSQEQGSAARREYQAALRLRPDLFQIRYLHAMTWDRPGLLLNGATLRQHGEIVPADRQMMPRRTIAECLALIHDHPDYALPYYRVGYDYLWPIGDKAKAKVYLSKYLQLGNPRTGNWQSAKSIVAAMG
jgi:tetratricopeptide (TPR) repeat protein